MTETIPPLAPPRAAPAAPPAPAFPAAPDARPVPAGFEATWQVDMDTGAARWEGNLEPIFGYAPGEIGNHRDWWRERVHPDDLVRSDRAVADAIAAGAAGWAVEYRFRRKDGSWAWVDARGVIDRDAGGRVRRLRGATIDISRFKETEFRLRLFAGQIPARATVTDRDLRVVWDAGGAFSLTPSVVGRTVPELFAGSPDRARVLDACARALAGESSRFDINNGAEAAHLHLEPFRDPDGNVTGVAGIAFDITDRVRAEEEARSGQRLLRQVLDTLPAGVVVVDRAGDIVLGNAAATGIWGRTIVSGQERRARSKGYWHETGKVLEPDEWGSFRATQFGETSRDELIDIETFDGRRKTIENFAAPIRDAAGAITGAVVVNQDVTERVRAEEALRQAQRLLVEAETLGQTGSWEQDLVTGRVFNTEENRRLFFGDDTTKGGRLEDYVEAMHPDDADWVTRRRVDLLAGTGSPDIEYRIVWPDGTVRWIFGRATVVRDASGRAIRVYGTNADVTVRKRAEEELALRTRQLESLSRKLIRAQEAERRAVARELHDDFGQVLTALKLNLQRRDRDDAESMALVDGAIARMRDLAQDLRPPLLDEGGLDLALRWYVEREAARAGLACRLTLETLDPRPSPTVEATCFRIAQEALTNIVRHAAARTVDVALRRAGDTLELVVRDDGGGFDVPAARRRASHGESQGLISMQERATLAGGALEIDSAPGRGTAVRARLPFAQRRGAPGP